ncbi:CHAT domain-containing protein [Streptomyces hoynatensis]|uniref:CHAT domain-containing protein n=1 Tax=Streptomyces hoynatensis TaxID=1141874 RepID=A0A3A9Z670_9ACTN|nr:CHAT domain-containing protein [Streptomyces hoynatensis]
MKAALRAVRESAAAGYADDLLRGVNLRPDQLRELDRLIGRWSALLRLLPGDAPPRSAAETALGLLLAARAASGPGARPGDRAEALRLLRRADATGAEPTVAARLALLSLLVPERVLLERAGSPEEILWAAFAFGRSGSEGPHAPAPDLAEACGVLGRLASAPLPPPLRQRLDRTRDRLELVRRVFSSEMTLEDLRRVLPLVPGHALPASHGYWQPPQPAAGAGQTGPPGRAQEEGEPELGALLRDPAGRADPERLERLATRIRAALHALPPDAPAARRARLDLAAALSHAGRLSGALQDGEAADELRRAVENDLAGLPGRSRPGTDLAVSRALHETARAERGLGGSALPGLIDELTRLHETLPADDVRRHQVALALGNALVRHGHLTGDADLRRAGCRRLREAIEVDWPLPGPYLPLLRAYVLALLAEIDPDAGAALLDEAVAATHGALAAWRVYPDKECALRRQLGRALLTAAERDRDPQRLEQAIAELTRARALAAASGRGGLHEALALLAQAHATRSRLPHSPGDGTPRTPAEATARARADVDAALKAGRAALAELAAEVLLQLGAGHGLERARQGAGHALSLARFAAAERRGREFFEVLETGRAMVLRAAAVSRNVPHLLTAAGHPALAGEWRQAEHRGLLRPRPAMELLGPNAPPGPSIPSTLRRRALAALGAGTGRGVAALVVSPTLGQLAKAVTAAGVDALVYLVPGAAHLPGHALLVRPGNPPAVLTLPRLTLTDPAPRAYLAAAAARSRLGPDAGAARREAAEERWRRALGELCDWAWPAAIGPLLERIAPRAAGPRTAGPHAPPQAAPRALPRIVLIPCDRLGLVPWHAARTRPRTGAAGFRYACEEAVFSHAPSGADFLRAAARPRLPLAGRQVLVADPELSLVWSAIEVEALRAAYYPAAQCYGELPGSPADVPGTPEEVLAALPGGAAPPPGLIHLACHALAGPGPARSALRLAGGELSVARILDHPNAGPPGAAGPLVVLGACETDLSTQDHDEALTLATALVARGASDVVGSRWATRDGATAVMMSVFHHCLTAEGLAPADALRAAQLWMLDPGRRPPAPLADPLLRREATRSDLNQPHLWAAFTHQGNPAPAG